MTRYIEPKLSDFQRGFQAGAAIRDAEIQRLQMALADAEALELGTAERCDQLRAHINDLRDAFQTFIDEHEECAILTRSNRQKLDGTRIEM